MIPWSRHNFRLLLESVRILGWHDNLRRKETDKNGNDEGKGEDEMMRLEKGWRDRCHWGENNVLSVSIAGRPRKKKGKWERKAGEARGRMERGVTETHM